MEGRTDTDTVILQHTDANGILIGIGILNLDYIQEDDGRWSAVCRELGTPAFADSLEEASSQLKDAILLQISEMDRLGDIEAFLQDHDVHLVSPSRSSGQWELVEARK